MKLIVMQMMAVLWGQMIFVASLNRKAVKKMAEQRLIDANALREDWLENGENEYIYDTNSFLSSIDNTPTIDPETLPIVRELRKKVKDLNDGLETLSKIVKSAYEQRDDFMERLERVTAERDAAVSDLENIMAYNTDTCQFCKNNQCYVRGGTKPCLPKWRGPDGDHP